MNKFRSLVKNDFVIAFHSPGIWISLIVGAYLSLSQYIKETYSVRKYLDIYLKEWPSMLVPHTVFTKWIGAEAYSLQYFAFFLLIPLLATMPAGARISAEKKSGYGRLVLIRANKRTYFGSKLLVSFILGGMVTVIPLLLNLYLTAMTLPSIIPNNAAGSFAINNKSFLVALFYSRPYLYIFIFLIFIFVFSGLTAMAACSLGIWGINSFLNTVYPFLTGVTLYAVLGELHMYSWIPFFFLNPAQLEPLSIGPIAVEMSIMVLIAAYPFFKGKKIDVY